MRAGRGNAFCGKDGLEPLGVKRRIARALVVHHPLNAQRRNGLYIGGKARCLLARPGRYDSRRGCNLGGVNRSSARLERCGVLRIGSGMVALTRYRTPFGIGGLPDRIQAQFIATPACLCRRRVTRKHRFKVFALQRQTAGPCNASQHDRTHHRARLGGEAGHVNQPMIAAVGHHQIAQAVGIATTIAHHHFLGSGEHARCVAENHGAVAGRQAVGDLTRGFKQLGRHQKIEPAGQWIETQDGFGRPGRQGLGVNFKVVGGGAGTLCHAGDGRGLRGQARHTRSRHQPAGQHAAPLAAQRAQQNGNWGAHPNTPCSTRRAAPWTRSRRRSPMPGLRTTSAR